MPEETRNDDIFEVKMPKRFTFDDNHRFHAIMQSMSTSRSSAVVLDMRQTEFIDSAGLGLLLLAREEAGKVGKIITIKSPQNYISKLFSTTRFDELFRVEK